VGEEGHQIDRIGSIWNAGHRTAATRRKQGQFIIPTLWWFAVGGDSKMRAQVFHVVARMWVMSVASKVVMAFGCRFAGAGPKESSSAT
jgi:hypothetical protein